MKTKLLEDKIKFQFNDKSLLKEALTHRSYAAEYKTGFDNQRLEFLGDAVVQIIVTDYLYRKYQDKNEGELTSLRAALVKKESLARIALYIELDKFILLGKGESDSNGNMRNSVLCDAFEALVGAIYLDSNIQKCDKILTALIKKLFPDPEVNVDSLNPKGTLQEITQKNYGEKPKYTVKKSTGPEHDMTYFVEVSLKDKILAVGEGKNIKSAERKAALQAIKKIK